VTTEAADEPAEWANQDLILYHGTDAESAALIRDGIDLARCRIRADFGRGFYTTTSRTQADDWAARTARRRRAEPVVLRFSAQRNRLAELEALWFGRGELDAGDFWTFVAYCRAAKPDHGRPGWYDVVVGPVTISPRFERGVFQGYDQISFHTAAALSVLRFHP
jgi:hypothetical protein